MVVSGFCSILKNFKEVQKSSVSRHKELVLLMSRIELTNASVSFIQGNPEQILVDISLLERIASIVNSLLELDSKSYLQIQHFQEDIKALSRTKRMVKILKGQILNFEMIMYKEKNHFENTIQEINLATKKFSEKFHVESLNSKEKIRKVLKYLVPSEIITKFEKKARINEPARLLDNFYASYLSEEPEIEANSDTENKKTHLHTILLINTLEKVVDDLLKIFTGSSPENTEKKLTRNNVQLLDEVKFAKLISPNELKVLKLKINRLHNRGSLTDEEAKSMLGKISFLPTSPNQSGTGKLKTLKGNLDFSVDIICDENPVTETREKQEQKENLGSSLSKDISTKVKSMKTRVKRSLTPARRITRNTSLPKAISISKYKSKDKINVKIKSGKLKSKSPHSFM